MTEIVMVSRGDAKTRNLCPKGNGSLSAILPTVHAPWSKVKLGEVLRLFHGKAIRSSSTGNCPVYGSNGVIGKCDTSLYDNAIIIGRVGAYCGSVAREKGLFWASDNTIVCKAVDDVADTDFCYYLLEVLHLNNYSGGTAQPLITQGIIKQIEVSLPPLPVQQRIADILSSYDDLIENNRRRIAILEETARLTYQKWFDGVEQDKNATLGDICCESRHSVSPNEIAPDMPYIGLEHMPRRSISLCEWETVQKVASTKLSFETGDILFGKIRPYFHKVGITFVDGVASSDAIVIKPLRPEWQAYVLMTVSSDTFVATASQGMKEGSKMPRADWKQLLNYPVAIPDNATLSSFNRILMPILEQLKILCFSIRNLATTRDMLLPRLMKGE